ncbi:transcriptional regulator [Sulfurisphaera javensis]|uniref:Transcriptional regulator n=1 Tax=Sulfurisphaera javensis TaxID=2049879 RepID=A0AAT9GTN9_9CREN
MQLTLPCEYSVKEILPAIRALIAEKLVEEKNLSIYKAADLMGLTPAAVENYLKKRRGTAVKELLKRDKEFMDYLEDFSEKVIKQKDSVSLSSYYCILCAEGKKVLNKNGYRLSHCIVESALTTYNFSLKE